LDPNGPDEPQKLSQDDLTLDEIVSLYDSFKLQRVLEISNENQEEFG